MNIETKLSRFKESVRKEAEAQNEAKIKALNEKYDTSVLEFEKKTTAKYKEMAADASVTAEKLKQKRIADATAIVKRTLMEKRASYIKDIFDNVLKKLDNYFKTPDYEQLIVDYIEHYKNMSQNSHEIIAQIMERDRNIKDSIELRCGVKVLIVDENFLGGVKIILDQKRVADCTMMSKFDAEKSRFNKIKIL